MPPIAIRSRYLAAARTFGEHDPRYGRSLRNLGSLYTSLGRYEVAEPFFRRALQSEIDAPTRDELAVVASRVALALDLSVLKRHEEAEPLYLEVIDSLGRGGTTRDELIWWGAGWVGAYRVMRSSYAGLGLAYFERGRLEDAEHAWRQVVGIRGSHEVGLYQLGRALYAQAKYGEAVDHLRRSIQLWDSAYAGVGVGRSPVQFPDTLELYAATLARLGRTAEAEGSASRAREVRRAQEDVRTKAEIARMRLPPDCEPSQPTKAPPGIASELFDRQLIP